MDLPRSQRIEFLDSIRGLAALAVLFSHAVGMLAAPPLLTPVLEFPLLYPAIDGKAAVAMFFVLSGFVLSRPYLKSAVDSRPRSLLLAPFYIKRITRIYFPFFCALGISALASIWLFQRYETIPAQTVWFKQFWSEPWNARDFLQQCFFLLHNANRQLMSQDWSLGVELKASALLPFLLIAWRRSPVWLALIGVLLFCFVGTGFYYLGFTLGIFLAVGIEALTPQISRKNFTFKCLLLLAGLLMYQARRLLPLILHLQPKEKWVWLTTSLGCVLILLACFGSRRLQRALNHKTVVFLGRISYGVYLLQFLILVVVIPWFVHQLNGLGIQTPLLVWLLAFGASIGLTILAGAIFFQLVEKPSMQFGHALAARFTPQRESIPQPAPATVGSARDP